MRSKLRVMIFLNKNRHGNIIYVIAYDCNPNISILCKFTKIERNAYDYS